MTGVEFAEILSSAGWLWYNCFIGTEVGYETDI